MAERCLVSLFHLYSAELVIRKVQTLKKQRTRDNTPPVLCCIPAARGIRQREGNVTIKKEKYRHVPCFIKSRGSDKNRREISCPTQLDVKFNHPFHLLRER